jgi:hypothetical protein
MPQKRTPIESVNVDVGTGFRQMNARRTQRVNFLVTKAEKAEILKEAESRRLTVSEYFLRLHRRVMEEGRSSASRKRAR